MHGITPHSITGGIQKGLLRLAGMIFYAAVLMMICPVAFPSLRGSRLSRHSGSDWDIATGTT
jgi:hypothetical protein